MSIPPVGSPLQNVLPFPFVMEPLTPIQPFSYRDGMTYAKLQENLRLYVDEYVIVEFNDKMTSMWKEFQNGIKNSEDTVSGIKTDWQALFDGFMANVVAELTALNDQAVTNLVNNPATLFGAAIRKLYGWEFNVKHYGAVGDGVTSDVSAIRAALAAAGAAAILNQGQPTVIFPPGDYWLPVGETLSWVFVGDGQFSKRFFDVPGNVRLRGEGGRISYKCSYDDRAVIFFTTGSNIVFERMKFNDKYDMAGGSRPTSLPIAGGDAYDATIEGIYRNITIDGCEFNRPWYPTKFAMTKVNGTGEFRDITIRNSKSYGEPLSTSSGGFNFTSKGPGRIRDVMTNNNKVYNVTVSAAIGFYGVWDFISNANYLEGSTINGGGVQTENGAKNGVITANNFINHFNHVWLDDSNHMTVTANNMRNDTPDDNYKAVRITYQGYDNDISHKSGDHLVSGNNTINAYIASESFSNPQPGGTPTLGDVIIGTNLMELDGVIIKYGIRTGQADGLIIATNLVKGAATTNIRLSPSIGQEIIANANLTKKIGAEASVGFDIINANAAHPLVANNRFVNLIQPGLTYVSARVGDMKISSGTGVPNISGNPGDLFTRRDASSSADVLYVKSGIGQLGWSPK